MEKKENITEEDKKEINDLINNLPEDKQTELNKKLEDIIPEDNKNSDSYLLFDDTWFDSGESEGKYKISFKWGSKNGIGTVNEHKSGNYSYYDNGVYLRLTMFKNDKLVKFSEALKTYTDDNNEFGGMTLQTNNGNINDMDGSKREQADWHGRKDGYETKLPGTNSIFYGVIQNKNIGTKTIGFNPAEVRDINLHMELLHPLERAEYKIKIEVLQQGLDTVLNETELKLNIGHIIPEVDTTVIEDNSIKPDEISYKVFGLKEGNKEKLVNLDEVKSFIDKEYDVTFNKEALQIEDGKISIVGEFLTLEDWYKIKKKGGNSTIPYRITICLNKEKYAKIAIYPEGKAILENLK